MSQARWQVIEWFEIMSKVLQDIQPENCYNMDETGVILSMLGSVKVLVGKSDLRDNGGVGVKRAMVTPVECVSANGRSLHLLVIWPASTHRNNSTKPTNPKLAACTLTSAYL